MSCIAFHKVYIVERNLELGGALQYVDICDCVQELQHDRIQHQNMTFHRHR